MARSTLTQRIAQRTLRQTGRKALEALQNAKSSLIAMGILDETTIDRAKAFVKVQNAEILTHLNRIGIATQDEVVSLRQQIKHLEEELEAMQTAPIEAPREKPRSAPEALAAFHSPLSE